MKITTSHPKVTAVLPKNTTSNVAIAAKVVADIVRTDSTKKQEKLKRSSFHWGVPAEKSGRAFALAFLLHVYYAKRAQTIALSLTQSVVLQKIRIKLKISVTLQQFSEGRQLTAES